MQIREKSQEELQAQVASFATVELNAGAAKDRVFGDIGKVAMIPESFDDPFGIMQSHYVDHIREVKKSSPETIAKRAELLESFAGFTDDIDALFDSFDPDDVESRKKAEGYLGSGTLSDGFLIKKGEKKFVAKIPKSLDETVWRFTGTDPNPSSVDDYTVAAIRGQGIPHLEQIVAISYAKGVVISEFMPGVQAHKLTAEDREKITDEQIVGLARTLNRARKAGILTETENVSNMFYDEVEGFGFIDYNSVDQSLVRSLGYRYSVDMMVSHMTKTINFSAQDDPSQAAITADIAERVARILPAEMPAEDVIVSGRM